MTTVILVPRRADGGRRDLLWAHAKARLEGAHPDWPIHEGHHEGGPFNRAAAINRAAKKAGRWDVAVIADADAIIDPDQLRGAAELAGRSGQFVIAYTRYNYLSHAMTDRILDGFDGSWWPGVEFPLFGACSTMVCVPRKLWNATGGFDEGFVGWGWEDVAFSVACVSLGGRLRVEGDVWHLWHQPSTENNQNSPDWQAGLARLNRYIATNEEPGAVRALLKELGVKKR